MAPMFSMDHNQPIRLSVAKIDIPVASKINAVKKSIQLLNSRMQALHFSMHNSDFGSASINDINALEPSQLIVPILKDIENNNDFLRAVLIMAGGTNDSKECIVEYLLPGNKYAQNKFLNMPIANAFLHYAAAEKLSQRRMTNQPVAMFFLMNESKKLLLCGMYDHFASPSHRSIDVTKREASMISSFPEEIKEEFKNKKEFFTVQVMPSGFDQTMRLGFGLTKGFVTSASIAYGTTFLYDYLQLLIGYSEGEISKEFSGSIGLGTIIGLLCFNSSQSEAKKAYNANRADNQSYLTAISSAVGTFKEVLYNDSYGKAVDLGKAKVAVAIENLVKNHTPLEVNPVNAGRNTFNSFFIGALVSTLCTLPSLNKPVLIESISKM